MSEFKEYRVLRELGDCSHFILVVGVYTLWEGEARDWAAYMGSTDRRFYSDDDVERIAKYGTKLSRAEVAAFCGISDLRLYRGG